MPRWDTRPGSNCALPPDLRYPGHRMPGGKTDASMVRSARLGAWSQGCDEPFSGDAWRSRMREWLMTSSLPRCDRDL